MKPNLKIVCDKPEALKELEAELVVCERQIAWATRERNEKVTARTALLKSSANLDDARTTHREIAKLDEDIALAQERRKALMSAITEAKAKEAGREWNTALQAAKQVADNDFLKHAAELQQHVETVVASFLALSDAHGRFARSLPGEGATSFYPSAFAGELLGQLETALAVTSDGKFYAKRLGLFSAKEMKERGYGDIKQLCAHHVQMAFQDRKPFGSTPPEAA